MLRSGRAAALVGLLVMSLVASGCSASNGAEDGTPDSDSDAPSAPGAGAATVDSRLFGTHVGAIAAGGQPLPPRAGSIRLWDSGVTWRQIEPVQGSVDWAPLESAVSQAESTGAEEIVWVHGSTPAWAALDPDAPGLYGPGTSSAPDAEAYLSILRQVAERFRGRITAYQVWNEANLDIFYSGDADYLAELTRRARDVLQEIDPDALVVGASTTIRRAGPVKDWYDEYSTGLAERGWPVDAMAVHLYPKADQGAGTRAAYIRMIRPWLAARGWTGPIWDTEVNYGDRREFTEDKVVVPQGRAVGWVARTYIDSLALGIDRVHWYSWNDHILGIDQVDPQTGAILPAGQAYLTVQDWLVGAAWSGCTGELMDPTGEDGAVTTCELTQADGTPGRILFSHGAATSVPMPAGVREVCGLDGSCAAPAGSTLPVGTSPILLRLGA